MLGQEAGVLEGDRPESGGLSAGASPCAAQPAPAPVPFSGPLTPIAALSLGL